MTRNHSLDSLRGTAVLLVIAVHVAQQNRAAFSWAGEFAKTFGALGVQLFFIVSGYTMMLTFGTEISAQRVKNFYVRRALRIAPLFWLATLFYLAFDGLAPRYWAPAGLSSLDVGLTFAFLHWLSPTAFNSVVPGGWSIAVEMQFYLLFPFLLLGLRRWPLAVFTAIVAVYVTATVFAKAHLIPVMAGALPSEHRYLAESFFYFWLPRQLICFGFGILLFRQVHQSSRSWMLLAVLAVPCLLTPWGRFVLALYGVAWVALRFAVSARWLTSIGANSYAMYLAHFAVLSLVMWCARQAGAAASFEVVMVIVTALAYAISRFVSKPLIEDPMSQLARELTSGRRTGVLSRLG